MWERAVLRSGARRACLANPNLQTLSYGHSAQGPSAPRCEWRAAHAQQGSKSKTESQAMRGVTESRQPLLDAECCLKESQRAYQYSVYLAS